MIFENSKTAFFLPRAISKYLKTHSDSLSQFTLPNMWLLVLLDTLILPPILKINTKISITNNENSYNPGQNIW